MADTPHLAYPFTRAATGKINVVEQDSDEHVMSCENVIVRCPQGFRIERPEFGWPFPEFHNIPLELGPLQDALRQFEPRGTAHVTQWADEAELATQHVLVEVEVR